MSTKGWIGVDLDGTIAEYTGWKGHRHIGQPIRPMVERVKRWLKEGWEVRIFTARVSARDGAEKQEVIKAVQDWCEEHIGTLLSVTCEKDYAMVELWDDRCVQVIPNTGEPVGQSTRGLS